MTPELLVSVEWLADHVGDEDIRVVDVRWYLTEPGRGRQEYEAGHIPGAVYLNVDTDLAAHGAEGPGRHPIPSASAFAETMSHAGIGNRTLVVAYDSSGGAIATRLWWLLRAYGHDQVALLDGGWQAWQAGGYPTETAVPAPRRATFIAQPQSGLTVDADTVEQMRTRADTVLIDARAPERYQGLTEPIDSRAGHIPGARNHFYGQNLRSDGTFKSPEELRALYAALGTDDATQIICYCGSGVTATHNLFALELAGRPGGLLYEGSWSDWSRDPGRPAAGSGEE